MLLNLQIRNYAIINELSVDFSSGLNVITGETGAGKSILLGALSLIMGSRADISVLKDKKQKCIVEGLFAIRAEEKSAFFEKYNLDFEEESIIRREISSSGKSRAFINDSPVTLNILRELSASLIDIHSQNQIHLLQDQSFQLSILDILADKQTLLKEYQYTYKKYLDLQKELDELSEKALRQNRDQDYLHFQLKEIEVLKLKKSENTELEKELDFLSHAENIKVNLNTCMGIIEGQDHGILEQLHTLQSLLKQIQQYDPEFEKILLRLENMHFELKDVLSEMQEKESLSEVNQEELERISMRLSSINHLLTKHHMTDTDGLLILAEDIRSRLQESESLSERIETIRKEKEKSMAILREYGGELHRARQDNIPLVEDALLGLLKDMGMKDAQIAFVLEYEKEKFFKEGQDKIRLKFSSNAGIAPDDVSRVASGGELSRLMLAIKYLQTGHYSLNCIIFDEIDMGTSGEIAIQVGKIMRRLSEKHQVISITHLPQIAAMGKTNIRVYKQSDSTKETETRIRVLEPREKEMEIAMMIGGENPSEHNIQSSKEMIEKFCS
jgi:DNA repair protein RecN (Recombination protein N)